MPSFLIVHSASPDGRFDAYRQPPSLAVGALRATLDWGDITLQVPAGDIPVTIFATRTTGQVEGATITVRVPRGTGTRLTFVPPLQPGGRAQLRIDGQWPADSSMVYYAARDGRVLVAPTPSVAQAVVAAAPPPPGSVPPVLHSAPPVVVSPLDAAAASHPFASQPVEASAPPAAASSAEPPAASAPPEHDLRVVGTPIVQPSPPLPAVGPMPGSTASVPPQGSSFGQQQGARIDPVRVDPVLHGAPSIAGQRAQHDVYGRRIAGDGTAAPIPTPAEFDRLEREAHEAQARQHEARLAQQGHRVGAAPARQDGIPAPIGLAPGTPSQPRQDWYPDPYRRAEMRWFDGSRWTSSVLRGGRREHDPLG